MTGSESRLVNGIRIALGWASGLYVLFGPLPYPIPWWGRFIVAFLLISIAHSTVSGIVLSNVARSGPAIVGLVRGRGAGEFRELGVGDRRGPRDDSEATSNNYAGGPSTMIGKPVLKDRRKSGSSRKPKG